MEEALQRLNLCIRNVAGKNLDYSYFSRVLVSYRNVVRIHSNASSRILFCQAWLAEQALPYHVTVSQSTDVTSSALSMTRRDEVPVTIVSSYTVDRSRMPDGTVEEKPGGPAHYCAEALRRLGCEYQVITGRRAIAEVVSSREGESYLISPLPHIQIPTPIPGDAVILSPVMREIDPDNLPDSSGSLFIDLQGFVREPGVFSGKERGKVDLTCLVRRAEVIKASERELSRLDALSVDALKGVTLLLTRGRIGVEIRKGRKTKLIPAIPVDCPDTIGAGDLFLASFVYFCLQSNSQIRACESAMRVTEEMLAERIVDSDRA